MGIANDLTSERAWRARKACSHFRREADDMRREQAEWIASLRVAGIKAAHPDDAWVDRERNTVMFVYPHFDDGVSIGDLIALGSPQWGSANSRHRIVRVTGSTFGLFSQKPLWHFDPLPESPIEPTPNDRSRVDRIRATLAKWLAVFG